MFSILQKTTLNCSEEFTLLTEMDKSKILWPGKESQDFASAKLL